MGEEDLINHAVLCFKWEQKVGIFTCKCYSVEINSSNIVTTLAYMKIEIMLYISIPFRDNLWLVFSLTLKPVKYKMKDNSNVKIVAFKLIVCLVGRYNSKLRVPRQRKRENKEDKICRVG